MSWFTRLFGSPKKQERKTKTASHKAPTRRKVFYVVGEAQINEDGTSRQDILFETNPGEYLKLIREPTNPYDCNAIRVDDCLNRCIGYLRREDAIILSPIIDAGNNPRAKVHRIAGGVPDAENYGCEVSLIWPGCEPHKHKPLYDDQIKFRKDRQRKRASR